MPVQDPSSVHANPYACTGSQKFKQLLTPGKPPDNSKTSLCWCRLPTVHVQILRLVQVPNNSNNSLCWCRLSMIHTQTLTLVKVPDNSKNSLHGCRLSMLHTKILMLVQVPNSSTPPSAGAGSHQLQHFLTPMQEPQRLARKSLHLLSIPTNETIPYACQSSRHVTHKFLHYYRFPTVQPPSSTRAGS
ncbi:hypothetical protein O181_007055 [Austropuccinia psidii MF-1]|uniref:Uncharacterized protein n=1 Tax=Austropuccinia psidii MF-1 TaxID=1389203 RepID=A0A9Q3BM66_9BASI|nr:hypothetical protein [Austropuccinia psidii MF-1]